jgi:glycerophosphoryl diester phosphodiesterase
MQRGRSGAQALGIAVTLVLAALVVVGRSGEMPPGPVTPPVAPAPQPETAPGRPVDTDARAAAADLPDSAVAPAAPASDRAAALRTALLDADADRLFAVAHRGDHQRHPENSLAGLRSCIDIGVAIVEIDIASSADGELVLMHDRTVDRTTTGSGRVAALTLPQLRALRLLHAGEPTDEPVPTLAEALEVARGRILLNLDAKGVDLPDLIAVTDAAEMTAQVIVKAPALRVDAAMRAWLAARPDVIFMPIVSNVAGFHRALADGPPLIEVIVRSPDSLLFNRDILALAQARGTRLWINALWGGGMSAGYGDAQAQTQPDQTFGPLIDRGFSVIQTDLPRRLQEIIDRR